MSTKDFSLLIGGNEIGEERFFAPRGVTGKGGRVSHLKRSHVMAAFIKTLHLLLKTGWGDRSWQVTNVWCLHCLFSY